MYGEKIHSIPNNNNNECNEKNGINIFMSCCHSKNVRTNIFVFQKDDNIFPCVIFDRIEWSKCQINHDDCYVMNGFSVGSLSGRSFLPF